MSEVQVSAKYRGVTAVIASTWGSSTLPKKDVIAPSTQSEGLDAKGKEQWAREECEPPERSIGVAKGKHAISRYSTPYMRGPQSPALLTTSLRSKCTCPRVRLHPLQGTHMFPVIPAD